MIAKQKTQHANLRKIRQNEWLHEARQARRAVAVMLDRQQAATALGIATATLDKWRSQNRGPSYVKMGAAVRYLDQDVADYLTGKKIQAGAEHAEKQREVVRPLRSGRRGVLEANRFGGHRTKQEKSAGDGIRRKAGSDRARAVIEGTGHAIQ